MHSSYCQCHNHWISHVDYQSSHCGHVVRVQIVQTLYWYEKCHWISFSWKSVHYCVLDDSLVQVMFYHPVHLVCTVSSIIGRPMNPPSSIPTELTFTKTILTLNTPATYKEIKGNINACVIYIETIKTYYWHSYQLKLRLIAVKEKGMFLYMARYPVRWTAQSDLHFTPWQTCSFWHQRDLSAKHSALLRLLHEDYSFTHFHRCI